MSTAITSVNPFQQGYGGSGPESYERYFVPAIGGPLATDLIARAALRPGERVLDVACGTGVVARFAAERVGASGTVAALDVNADMLAVARTVKAPTEPPIRWYESPAESMPLPDGAFDAVLCQLGLQFIADKVAALREMRRVTATGGRVLVSTPSPSPFLDVLEDALARRIPGAAVFMRVVFSLHDRAAIERLFGDAGLAHVAVEPYTRRLTLPAPRDFLWQYIQGTPIAGLIAEADHSLLEALEREVVERWQPWVVDGGLAYEQEIVVTTARR